ncbi:uracil-DNA glycosylase [Paraburkholderia ginsengiterrae]|uniref:Type-4 uracil-DNA glycosylase n=1 Tax=Paraburkholderia ginsengiterrae TaxID=1462993 RepID=A0A1A9N6C6_9BURK|nr:uracil-DNA glycosylase [Paraburkholderia ginsengiterrae]OAJ59304.1 uracil-DNA glycosylase [Paraburkholderia ginsengiterrae]OAJ61943.1 uracil-DNA glycosylase [Paraburkholderia ginsengiterrae]
MALHESVLEEFGLAPLWVRRGMAPARETAADGQQAGAEQNTGRADARDEVSEPHAAVLPPVTARPVVRAGEERQASEQTIQRAVQRTDQRVDEQADVPSPPDERRAAVRADQSPSAANARERLDERQPDARPRPSEPAQQSRPAEPPAFDGPPPDDDFAWFDDLPAHAPSEARQQAPAAPAIHTLDWDALSARVAACENCRLCEKRTNTVFGVGDRNADWMLIGEAPGENEDRQGEPFVGQAGKLLDSMLRSLALARDTNVYIANVIKCRPPGNRNPEPDEVARCEPYLQRQVALVKPKLIVALGRFAAQSLLKTDASISSLRGRVHEYEGVPVIVTYHPAYLLRSLPDKAKAWADLCLARDTWRAAGGAPSTAPR